MSVETDNKSDALDVSKERLFMLRAKLLDMHLAWMKQGAELLQYHVRLRMLEEHAAKVEKEGEAPRPSQVQ